MRVLLVSQAYPPQLEKGGQAVKTHALATRLAARGNHVTVLTTSYHSTRTEDTVEDGVRVVRLGRLARYRAVTLNPSLAAWARRLVSAADIVHVVGIYDLLGPAVASAARRARTPYVVEPIGMVKPIVRSLRKKRAYHSLLGKPLLASASVVVATSAIERDEIVASGVPPERVTIRRNGVDLTRFASLPPRGSFRRELGLDENAQLVLTIGRVSRKKGLDLLVRAHGRLAKNVHLAIVGPDDHDGAMDSILATRDPRVHVVGARYGDAALQALADADVFVLASRSENFGNTVAESLAAGVPTVVTETCGVAEHVCAPSARVVPVEEGAIVGAIEALLAASPSERAEMGAHARATAARLGWDIPITEQQHMYARFARLPEASPA